MTSNPERMPHLGYHATNRVSVFALRVLLICHVEDGDSHDDGEQSLHPKSLSPDSCAIMIVLEMIIDTHCWAPYYYGQRATAVAGC